MVGAATDRALRLPLLDEPVKGVASGHSFECPKNPRNDSGIEYAERGPYRGRDGSRGERPRSPGGVDEHARAAIIEATVALLREDGYPNLRLDAVAARARVRQDHDLPLVAGQGAAPRSRP